MSYPSPSLSLSPLPLPYSLLKAHGDAIVAQPYVKTALEKLLDVEVSGQLLLKYFGPLIHR